MFGKLLFKQIFAKHICEWKVWDIITTNTTQVGTFKSDNTVGVESRDIYLYFGVRT